MVDLQTAALFFEEPASHVCEAGTSGKPDHRRREMRMLESAVELLGGLCSSALILLIAVCIVGSIVAALRAVGRGSATLSAKR